MSKNSKTVRNKNYTVRNKFLNHSVVLLMLLVLELILYGLSFVTDWRWLGTERSSIIGIVTFALTTYGYSFYSNKQWLGISLITTSLAILTINYMIYGDSLGDAVLRNNMDLPICLIGITIMIINSIIKHKRIREIYNKPVKVEKIYKFIVYSFMFSVFVYSYATSNLVTVTNTFLKTMVILQSILPTYIIISYITFTDITLPVMIIYNIVYIIAGLVVINYTGFSLYIVLNIIMLTLMIWYNIYKYYEEKRHV